MFSVSQIKFIRIEELQLYCTPHKEALRRAELMRGAGSVGQAERQMLRDGFVCIDGNWSWAPDRPRSFVPFSGLLPLSFVFVRSGPERAFRKLCCS